MELTPEILETTLTADENLRNAAVTALEKAGLFVRTKEQDESFLASKIDPLVEEKIKDRIKEVHDKYDQDLLELTGERKAPTEKTYDFLKRKITDIKKEKPNSVNDDRLKELEKLLEDERNSKTSEIEKLQSEFLNNQVDMNVSASVEKFNIAVPTHLKTDEEKQAYVSAQRQMIKRDFLSNFAAKKDDAGNLVFYKGDELAVSTKDGKPLSAGEIIQKSYKAYFIDDARNQGGAGSGRGGNTDTFSTKVELIAHLEAKGLKRDTKAFMDEYAKLVKEHGIVH